MATTVGVPITKSTLSALPDYVGKDITRMDVVNYTATNQYLYQAEAANEVNKLKEAYGNGVSTKCMLYNATGGPITFTDSHDWHGHMYSVHPTTIQNGQWGFWLHTKTSGAATGSEACHIYYTTNNDGTGRDVFLGWESPYSGSNSTYVEAREVGHWPGKGSWGYMESCINNGGLTKDDNWGGVNVHGQIGVDSSAFCTFVVKLS